MKKKGYHYEYDYENRVTHIFKMNGQTPETVARYAYDALGRRIWKYDPTAAAADVYYYYNDQWQILCEYTAETTSRQSIEQRGAGDIAILPTHGGN